LVRRTTNIRFSQFDHVFSACVLLLRSPEEKSSRGLVFPGSNAQGASHSQNTKGFKTQSGAHGASDAPRPGGVAAHGLAEGSERYLGSVEREKILKELSIG